MKSFKIIPVLGRKTDVLPDDPSMIQMISDGVAAAHDAGGLNFDLKRKRNACSKAYGKTKRSNTATDEKTLCMGLFELYDGTNMNHIYFDNGKAYYYDASWDPVELPDTYLDFDALTGSFTVGNTIIGGKSGATAVIVFVYVSGTTGTLYLESITGTFQDNEAIYEAGYGSELLTDGDCSSDSFTIDGDGFSYDAVGDEYDCDGTQTESTQIYQANLDVSENSFYITSITLANCVAGTVLQAQLGGAGGGGDVDPAADGTTSAACQAGAASTTVYVQVDSDFNGSVTTVSVKKITNAALANGTVSTTTFANDSADLYSTIRVGEYLVFADHAEHTPMKWKHGDGALSTLVASGTQYKFRYLMSFQRRVIGLYSDQTNGNIDVRWSSAWPSTAITALSFSANNQLYIPNDDPITGGAVLGMDKAFIFCENSIQQLVYYPDFSSPFRCYTVVPYQGSVNHHSIVGREGVLYFYNKNYGFCEYYGGTDITPIGNDIQDDLKNMNTAYLPLIVGVHHPYARKILWTVPMGGFSSCDHIVAYCYETKQWEIMDRSARYIDMWKIFDAVTWNSLITALGGTGATWAAAGSSTWADYVSENNFLMYGGTDGHLYSHAGESLDGDDIDGYSITPVLYFGNKRRFDNILEMWFDIGLSSAFSIDVYHRDGNTTGELINKPWTLLGSVSCDDSYSAELKVNLNARLHQFKWGTDLINESFQVNGIVFKYNPGSER